MTRVELEEGERWERRRGKWVWRKRKVGLGEEESGVRGRGELGKRKRTFRVRSIGNIG